MRASITCCPVISMPWGVSGEKVTNYVVGDWDDLETILEGENGTGSENFVASDVSALDEADVESAPIGYELREKNY